MREAIANALIHRDLRASGTVAVRAYPGRLEIWSPGSSALPAALSSYADRGGVSLPRNPLVASIARQLGIAHQLGRGLATIQHASREKHGQVSIDSSREGVMVTLRSPLDAPPLMRPE